MARFICLIDHVELTITADMWHNYSAVMQWNITKVRDDSELKQNLTNFKNLSTEVRVLGYQQTEIQNCDVTYLPTKSHLKMRLDFRNIGQDALDNITKGRVFIINGIAFLSTCASMVLKLAPGVEYSHGDHTYLWYDIFKRESAKIWQDQLKEVINFEDLKDAVMTQDDKFIPYIRMYSDVEFTTRTKEDEELEEVIEYSTVPELTPVQDSSLMRNQKSSSNQQSWVNDLW